MRATRATFPVQTARLAQALPWLLKPQQRLDELRDRLIHREDVQQRQPGLLKHPGLVPAPAAALKQDLESTGK